MDAQIADNLFHAILRKVAVTTVKLERLICNFKPGIGDEARRMPRDCLSAGRNFTLFRSLSESCIAQQRKQFFFEKKNQKTLTSGAYAAGQFRDSDIKVFWFFSSEKNCFRLLRRRRLDERQAIRHAIPGGIIPAWQRHQ
jgi:hypothetical protein